MKKILIIGAGFLQSFAIRKAKEMGLYTLAIDGNPNSVGFNYADEYKVINIVDQKACLRYAKTMNIDGVLTVATDYGVLSASYIAKEMNLPGLDYEVAKLIKDKHEVRKTLSEHKVDDVLQFYEVSSLTDLEQMMSLIKYPIMVKPTDGSGSKAAKRVDSANHLKAACEEAIKASLTGKALLEDFIDGKEYGVESFVYKKEVNILGILDKYMTEAPIYAELGHSMPCDIRIKNKVEEIVKRAIEILGVNYGSINMDILITKDERICIIDIGARMGGNLIGSHIIPYSTDYDYIKNLIKAALGEKVTTNFVKNNSFVATQILALQPGRIISLPDFEEIKETYQVEIFHSLTKGMVIREYRNNLDGCGYIVAVGNNLMDVFKRSEEAKKIIDLKILRSV